MPDNRGGNRTSVDTLLESTLDSVDAAETLALEAAQTLGFDEDTQHQLGMSVREAMVNAVVHGNRYSSRKKVRFIVTGEGDRLMIQIIDQGDGFDPNGVPNPLIEENLLRQSGRGLLLIQAFVDEFKVQRAQPGGTEVTLVKYRSQ